MLPATSIPVAFVNVTDRERATAFYRDTLGLTVRSDDEFGTFFDLGGALLRVTPMPDHRAHPHPVLGWKAPDIKAAVAALAERGVTFAIYDGMGQDEAGIWSAPDGSAQVAWFSDPDGNVLSVSRA